MNGNELASFTDIKWPVHLSIDGKGRVMVVDFNDHHILQLSSDLKQGRVLIETSPEVKLCGPARVCHNEVKSQVYVLHRSDWLRSWAKEDVIPKVVSQFSVR